MIGGPDEVLDRIAGQRRLEVEHAQHPPAAHPDEVNTALLEFLAD
jgi:hypothetical protein